MTHTSRVHMLPKSLKLKKDVNKVSLIVHGQGVIFFNASDSCHLRFYDANGVPGLRVHFTDRSVEVNLEPSNEPLIDTNNSKGLTKKSGAYYWFSLDSQNQRLYAGIGEARIEKLYTHFNSVISQMRSCF